MGVEIGDKLLSLKSKIDSLAKRRDQIQWELDAANKELREKYGLGSVEEALAEGNRLIQEADEMEEAVAATLASIEEEYRGLLEMAKGGRR